MDYSFCIVQCILCMHIYVLEIQVIVVFEADILCVLLSPVKFNVQSSKYAISCCCRGWDKAVKFCLSLCSCDLWRFKEVTTLERKNTEEVICSTHFFASTVTALPIKNLRQCHCLQLCSGFSLLLKNNKTSRPLFSLMSYLYHFPHQMFLRIAPLSQILPLVSRGSLFSLWSLKDLFIYDH